MTQEYTQKEIKWRVDQLMDSARDSFIDNCMKASKEVGSEYDTIASAELIVGSLVYLTMQGAFNIYTHKRSGKGNAVFTSTRDRFQKNLWSEPSELNAYDRPSMNNIYVPDVFIDSNSTDCTHISVSISYPEGHIGALCQKMIGYLRDWCKQDVHVINLIVFMHYHFDEELYQWAIHHAFQTAFMYDHWNSSSQFPYELIQTMYVVLGEDIKEMYDPFMSKAFSFLACEGAYYGQTTDNFLLGATMLVSAVYGHDTEHMELANCVDKWEPRNCDTIFATPEIGLEANGLFEKKVPISTWLLDKMDSTLQGHKCKAVMLVPASVLTSSSEDEIYRRCLTDRNFLDTVALLPANILPKTGIATAIVLLRSDRDKDAPITFVDFSKLTKDEEDCDDETKAEIDFDRLCKIVDNNDERYIREVTVADVISHEYEWYPSKYIKDDPEVRPGYMKVAIRDLIEPVYTFKYGCGVKNYVLEESNMSSCPFDEDLACDVVEMHDFMERYSEKDFDIYSNACFIIACDNKSVRTYYWNWPSEFSIIDIAIPSSCHTYRVNPDLIDIQYLRLLIHNLHTEIIEEYPNATVQGIMAQLLKSEVIIPLALEEQKRLFDQAKLNYAIEKAHKEGLDEAISSMKQEYMTEVRMRKHDMKPFLSQLDSQAKLIAFYLDKIDGNEETVAKIREKLTGVSNAVSELRLHLNRLTEEDIYGTPEVLNPISILKELTGTFSNYAVSLEVDEIAFKEAGIEEPQIFISPVDFSTLASTIIENAVAHAFVGDASDYRVLINFSYNQEKQMYTIDFWNNGNPMPEGMDKFRYGLKGEKGARSKGTGLGGYRVKSITRHYGGDYDVFISRTKNSTTIRVLFPKYMKDEEV